MAMSSKHLKECRIATAAETLEIIKSGVYDSGDETIDISSLLGAAQANSTCFGSFDDLRASLKAGSGGRKPRSRPGRLELSGEKSIRCAQRLRQEMGDCAKIAVLNFASAKNPGGGFLNGAQAQEESLACSSALYCCLTKHMHTYYSSNRPTKDGVYTDHLIWSPDVPVFRDQDGNLLSQPFCVSFITLPAPNAGVILQRNSEKVAAKLIEETMRRRIQMILHLAAAQEVDALVLGAYGCGCFQNNPAEVARQFQQALTANDCFFLKQFARVAFPIFDISKTRDTFKAFDRQFGAAARVAPTAKEDEQQEGKTSANKQAGGQA